MRPGPLGIQLGSARCACAVVVDGTARALPGPDGRLHLPSRVGVLEDGRVVVGEEAALLATRDPSRVAADFVRRLGRDVPVQLAGQALEPTVLVALLLSHLKARAEIVLGSIVESCVLTVPATFEESQRLALLRAAGLAGLEVERLVEEPVALLTALGIEPDPRTAAVVVDLGARHLDVAVVRRIEGLPRVLVAVSDPTVGGERYVDRLLAWVLSAVERQLEVAELLEPERTAEARAGVEQAIAGLAEDPSRPVRLTVPWPGGRELELDGAGLAARTHDLTERLRSSVLRCLAAADLSLDRVGEVVLVGGAARIPSVVGRVRALLGPERLRAPREGDELAVCAGAASLAGTGTGRRTEEPAVSPAALRVEILRRVGERCLLEAEEGLLLAGAPLPTVTEAELALGPGGDLHLRVRTGEGDGEPLARVDLPGRWPAGVTVFLRAHCDRQGRVVLEVRTGTADEGGGEVLPVLFHLDGHELSVGEAARLLATLEDEAHGTRDELGERRLLLHAESVASLLSVRERWWLDQVLDAYRHLLREGPGTTLGLVRSDLLGVLEELGHPFRDDAGADPLAGGRSGEDAA